MLTIAKPLLEWFHQNKRGLPFRLDPSPYHIWVSEIMLQQTRVNAALPYYNRWMQELPTIADLAACDEEKLHKLWEGLGYYNRVRNLQKAAKIVVEQYGGELPADYDKLLALPGIGEYTAGAITSIAFGLPEVAVDGNVLRVFARLLADEGDITLPAVKKRLAAEVQAEQPADAPGDYNEALMELGALVCVPGTPNCGICPLQQLCKGNKAGIADTLPRKAAKKTKTEHDMTVFVAKTGEQIVLQQRPRKGLLAGLWQPVLLEGKLSKKEAEEKLQAMFGKVEFRGKLPASTHIFTHRIWKMAGWQVALPPNVKLPEDMMAVSVEQIREEIAIPGAFKAYLPFLIGES